jgi:hypothetical protein
MSLVLLIVVPRAVAIVLLLLAYVGLCGLCRLHLRLRGLTGRLSVCIGIEWARARSVGIGASVLVPGKVGIGVIRVVRLGGRLASGSRCSPCGRSGRGQCGRRSARKGTHGNGDARLDLQRRVVTKCRDIVGGECAEPTF